MTAPAARSTRMLLPDVAVPWWAFVVATVGLLITYIALQDNGLLMAGGAEMVHEFFHNGRHALGVPCH